MFDFCGIGNACIDIVANVDDRFLKDWDFRKSICTYLELDKADALERALPSPRYIPGGCGANTAAIVSALGGKSAFIGRIAKDSIGAKFLADMKERNIHYTGKPDEREGAGSTRIFALITPDTERTFAAYYGVQEDLSVADLDPKSIAHSRFLYLDGYALNSRYCRETFLTAADMAKSADKCVVLSPSDLSILTKYPDVIEALTNVSDVIVCNSQEAMHMAGTNDLGQAISFLQDRFVRGAITAGDKGAYVFDRDTVESVPAARPPGTVCDTNGAGDAFAGGFLFGLAREYPLNRAAALGNRCAASIITHAGARPVHDLKPFVDE